MVIEESIYFGIFQHCAEWHACVAWAKAENPIRVVIIQDQLSCALLGKMASAFTVWLNNSF